MTERLTKIIKPTDYCPFLLFHMGVDDTTKSLKTRLYYEQLGMKAKGTSVFPMEGQHLIREQRILEVNHWLK